MDLRLLKLRLGIAAVAAIVVAVFLFSLVGQDPLPEGFVSSNGRTESTEVDITTKFGGRVEEVLVKEGDAVDASQILSRLETRELEAQLRRAQAEVRRTEQEKHFAVAVIAQRKSELSLSLKDLERSKGLYENDTISLEQLQRSETSVETARATLAAAQAQLSNAKAAIEAAVANTELIKTQIEDSVLRSPIQGRVLYRLVEPGEVLPSGGKVLTVLDPFDIYMTLFLPTHEVARVAIGAKARIVLDGIPERVIPAHVTYVAPQAQFTPKEVETRSERDKLMFRLKVQLDGDYLRAHPALAKSGMPGVAYIQLETDSPWPDELRMGQEKRDLKDS